jgi:hypothetical protein
MMCAKEKQLIINFNPTKFECSFPPAGDPWPTIARHLEGDPADVKQNLSVVCATNLSSFALLHRVPHPPLGHASTNCDLHKKCSKFIYVYPFSIVAIKNRSSTH